jgi:hypothetical protein
VLPRAAHDRRARLLRRLHALPQEELRGGPRGLQGRDLTEPRHRTADALLLRPGTGRHGAAGARHERARRGVARAHGLGHHGPRRAASGRRRGGRRRRQPLPRRGAARLHVRHQRQGPSQAEPRSALRVDPVPRHEIDRRAGLPDALLRLAPLRKLGVDHRVPVLPDLRQQLPRLQRARPGGDGRRDLPRSVRDRRPGRHPVLPRRAVRLRQPAAWPRAVPSAEHGNAFRGVSVERRGRQLLEPDQCLLADLPRPGQGVQQLNGLPVGR